MAAKVGVGPVEHVGPLGARRATSLATGSASTCSRVGAALLGRLGERGVVQPVDRGLPPRPEGQVEHVAPHRHQGQTTTAASTTRVGVQRQPGSSASSPSAARPRRPARVLGRITAPGSPAAGRRVQSARRPGQPGWTVRDPGGNDVPVTADRPSSTTSRPGAWCTTAPTASALAARLAEGPITLYYGCDPDAPTACTSATSSASWCCGASRTPATGRWPWPAAPPGWWATPAAGPRSATCSTTPRSTPTWPPSRPRWPGSSTSTTGGRCLVDNRDWTADVRAARLPAGRGQARHGQPDAGPGVGQGPPRRRARHQLHRVQLHAAAGPRLPAPARRPRRRAADRRVRPVGQHPGRASTWSAGCAGAAVHGLSLAAAHRRPTGRKLGKTTGAAHLARPGPHEPVPVLPALDADRRPPGAGVPGQVHAAAHGRGRRRWPPPTPSTPSAGGASAAWPRRSPRLVHGPAAPRPRPRRPTLLFGGVAAGGGRRTPWRWWRPRCRPRRCRPPTSWRRASTWCRCWWRPAWPASKGDARRAIEQGAVSVNGERVGPGATVGRRRRAPRALRAAAQGQEDLRAPRRAVSAAPLGDVLVAVRGRTRVDWRRACHQDGEVPGQRPAGKISRNASLRLTPREAAR